MKQPGTNYTLLGAFVLVAIGVLIGCLVVLGDGRGPTQTYYTELNSVRGIKFGTPVSYAGYPLGQVESVTPVQDESGTRYELALALRSDWRIPRNSTAKVVADGLLSAVSIDIAEGDSAEILAPGERLHGIGGGDVFSSMNAVASEFEALSRQTLRPMLHRLHGSVDLLAAAMEQTAPVLLDNLVRVSAQVEDQLPGGLLHLSQLTESLNHQVPAILSDLQAASGELRAAAPVLSRAAANGAQQLDGLLSDANVKHLASMLQRLDAASGDLRGLIGSMQNTAGRIDRVVVDVDSLVASVEPDVDRSLGSIRDLLARLRDSVEVISYHLEGSSRNMQEFSRRIRDNPSALLLSSAPQETRNR